MSTSKRHRVVVVGGGFGGLAAVRALRRADADVTLVDRRNFHLFQPLLYEVATGSLSAGEIATPLRTILKRQSNARVVLGDVVDFDADRRRVRLADGAAPLDYDTLIVAAGAAVAYHGHEAWRADAPGLKTLEDAMRIRARVLAAFEAAELEPDPERRREWLTFAVVGGGPTGVELAGQVAEIAHATLRREFRTIEPGTARVLLVEGADRVLTGMPVPLSKRAGRALERIGVTPLLDRAVIGIGPRALTLRAGDAAPEMLAARTTFWAAGVRASGLAGLLADATGATVDTAGRVVVAPDLSLPEHPEILVLGDMAALPGVPGVAPAAMQQGRYAGRLVRARLRGRERPPFRYVDKGDIATIGRRRAVMRIGALRLSGTLAWLTYLLVHLVYLVGLQNRAHVLIRWVAASLTHRRGARLIVAEPPQLGSGASA